MVSVGGEERTIEFMESQTVITSRTPLLEEAYAYGVVEHPFPLNCFLKDWYLGPKFYHAVKIGIVQYVCIYVSEKLSFDYMLLLKFYRLSSAYQNICLSDDTEDDLCITGYDSGILWGLRRRKV